MSTKSIPLRNAVFSRLADFRHAPGRFHPFSGQVAAAENLTPQQPLVLLAIRGREPGQWIMKLLTNLCPP